MPREMIPSYASDPDHGLPAVSVGWGKEHPDIEVMSRLDQDMATDHYGELFADLDVSDETRAEIVNRLTSVHAAGLGWCARLDRNGVQRLITTLRKARNQAFGADA